MLSLWLEEPTNSFQDPWSSQRAMRRSQETNATPEKQSEPDLAQAKL